MEKRIDIKELEQYGLSDIYLSLIEFISSFVRQNYDPMEYVTGKSKYATAFTSMRDALDVILEFLKNNNEIFIPSLNRNVDLKMFNIEEQTAIVERCKECLLIKANEALINEFGNSLPNRADDPALSQFYNKDQDSIPKYK